MVFNAQYTLLLLPLVLLLQIPVLMIITSPMPLPRLPSACLSGLGGEQPWGREGEAAYNGKRK